MALTQHIRIHHASLMLKAHHMQRKGRDNRLRFCFQRGHCQRENEVALQYTV